MNINIFENGVLIAQDSKDIIENWTHRWFDNSTNKFKKETHQGRLRNFYPWCKWIYQETK